MNIDYADRLLVYAGVIVSVIGIAFGGLYVKIVTELSFAVLISYLVFEDIQKLKESKT